MHPLETEYFATAGELHQAMDRYTARQAAARVAMATRAAELRAIEEQDLDNSTPPPTRKSARLANSVRPSYNDEINSQDDVLKHKEPSTSGSANGQAGPANQTGAARQVRPSEVPGMVYRCWLCKKEHHDKYEFSRHFNIDNAHPGEDYHIDLVDGPFLPGQRRG